MNRDYFFPKEILEYTTEYHLSKHPTSTKVVYLTVVLAILATVVMLPFINIDISVKSQGVLKAATEVSTLKATSSGYVKEMYAKENATVEKGQLLFAVQSPVLEEKENFLQSKLQDINLFLHDVKQLTYIKLPSDQLPTTSLYRQQLTDYQLKLADRQTRFLKVKQDYDRNKKLFDQKVIATAEFENFKFEFEKAKGEIEMLKQAQLSAWQLELRNYKKEKTEYENQLVQVQKEKDNLNIKAPVGGTVQNLVGVYSGSPVFANQDLAQISPSTNLLAEVYVSPNDIGLLREGMDVRMQVGAFNYNQWGLLHGKIKEISSDIQVMNNQTMFEVKCSLDQEFLQLKNGYQGKFKKGMTLQARFVVTKRSLWQLLYDKVDDWVNPNTWHASPISIKPAAAR